MVATSTASIAPSGEANIRIDIDDKASEVDPTMEDIAPTVRVDKLFPVIGTIVLVFVVLSCSSSLQDREESIGLPVEEDRDWGCCSRACLFMSGRISPDVGKSSLSAPTVAFAAIQSSLHKRCVFGEV